MQTKSRRLENGEEFGIRLRHTRHKREQGQAHKSNGSEFECSYNKSTTMVRDGGGD